MDSSSSSTNSARNTARRPRAFISPPLFFPRPHIHTIPFRTNNRPCRVHVRPCANLNSTDPATQYVPLHVHSDFSLLDGASQLPSLVQRAQQLGVPALALTDHGVLYGAIQLVRTCAKSGVKPIIGNEMYLVNDAFGQVRLDAEGKPEKPPKKYHLIVLAKNTTGYRNLVKLTTMAHLHGKVGKGIFARPCINKAQLFQHREGLIVSSACLGGEIPQAILNDDMQSARCVASWYRDVFGDDFYLEIQDHGSEEDKKVNPRMIELSRELGIKVIATNDSHFTNCLDAEAHDAMICIQTGKMLSDENRLQYAGNEYFKSVEEMRKCFVDHLPLDAVNEALCNTINVAEKVEQYDLFGETRIPDFPIPHGFDKSHDDYLTHVAYEGLKNRLAARHRAGLADKEAETEYYQRLDHELGMIHRMGFSSYFLVVWDYVRYAKERHIPVGPGRGSAAGSLVAFALRITDVDPIPFNLLFERFLNPERKSMPDIDTDFSVSGREEIISYVSERYGADRVAQIITFNRLTSKAVLKDVARVHEVPYAEADRLAKLIPVVRGKPATLTKMLSDESPSKDFQNVVNRNPSYKTWIDKAMRIEGANKTFGIHAAGVVISASPLTDIVPLSKAKHGETITQYAMEDVESLGLLKMDFLGLKNLTVIETALQFINEGRRKLGLQGDLDFSVDALPLDDENTYKLLSEGELDGIFQLDASGGMRSIVRELRPSSLEDISSILALYRPGPLDAGLIPKFIRRKHGREAIEYDHPLLEPILRETYGIMVYQEQIMRIARDLAGYSLGQADILRRAMGKKKTADMERERPRFVSGAKERGVSEDKAVELFDMMIKFAEYCFNKSHSTAYAYLTYQTAYLKANYPVEYAAALLRSNMNQSDKLVRYLSDANNSGVKVAPPSINKSDLGFTVDRSDKNQATVLFGLEAVKAVGESVSSALLEERRARGPFTNIIDLIERVDLRVLNRRAVGALIQAGAFDELHPNRKVLLSSLEGLLAMRRKLRDRKKRRESKQLSEEEQRVAAEEDMLAWEEMEIQLAKDSESNPDFSFLERLAGEKATLGFYASGHPLYELQPYSNVLDSTRVSHVVGDGTEQDTSSIEGSGVSHALADGSDVMILSCVTELKKVNTAKGKRMARWMIEDPAARVPGVVFPGSYDIVEQTISKSRRDIESEDVTEQQDSSEKDVKAESEGSELPLVVEEDARVVVWGKVDRESSGTVQVIIDDVQRVEDIQVVLATARFNPELSHSDHQAILRAYAADILEVELSGGSNRYVDPNGVVRRRRSRSVPLAKKCRIPLILRCLDEHGNICAHMNAGNAVRFPEECVDLMQAVERKTGMRLELLSIQDLITTAVQTSDTDGEEREEQKNVSLKMQEEHDKESMSGAEEDEKIDNAVDVFEPLQRVEDLSQDDGEAMSEKENERDPGRADPMEVDKDENSERQPKDLVYVQDVALTAKEHLEFQSLRRIMESHLSQLRTERQEESLRASILRPGQRRTVARAESKAPVKLVEYNSDVTLSGGVTTVEAPRTVTANNIAFTTEDVVSSEQNSVTPQAFHTQTRGFGESHNNPANGDQCNSLRLDNAADETEELDIAVKDNESIQSSATKSSSLHVKQSSTKIRDELTHSPHKVVVQENDMEGGLTLAFEEFSPDGLVDAVGLIGGDVAERYAQCAVSAIGFSGFDMSKMNEKDAHLRLTGEVVFAKGDILFVVVHVKEVTPTGGRKRVRSFGPVLCIYKASQTVEQLALKTKKARKSVESARELLDSAVARLSIEVVDNTVDDGLKPGTGGIASSSLKVSHDMNSNTSDAALRDGGYVLSLLGRAAKLCVDRRLQRVDSTVLSIDGVVVEGSEILSRVESVTVQGKLEGTTLGTAKVQVQAILTASNGESSTYSATLRVSNAKLKGRKAEVIRADEDLLFDGNEVAECLKQRCSCINND